MHTEGVADIKTESNFMMTSYDTWCMLNPGKKRTKVWYKRLFAKFSVLPLLAAAVPTNWQIKFQDPATLIMDGIIDLHHDIMAFLVFIAILVFYMLTRIVLLFDEQNAPPKVNYNHNAVLEVI